MYKNSISINFDALLHNFNIEYPCSFKMGQNGGKLDIAFSSLRDHLQDGVSIRVQAIVKEGLSNTKQNESTEISVHTTPVTIDWAKTNPSSFKPGLRYSFNVSILCRPIYHFIFMFI